METSNLILRYTFYSEAKPNEAIHTVDIKLCTEQEHQETYVTKCTDILVNGKSINYTVKADKQPVLEQFIENFTAILNDFAKIFTSDDEVSLFECKLHNEDDTFFIQPLKSSGICSIQDTNIKLS